MPRTTDPRPRVPLALAERIDEVRGDVPFERWVLRALEAALDAPEMPKLSEPRPASDKPRHNPKRSSGSASAGVPTVDGAPKPGPTRATKSCVRGCTVPVANPMKRCVPHGLPLREAE